MSFIKSQPRHRLHLGMWLLARPFPTCLLLWVLREGIFSRGFSAVLCSGIHPKEGLDFYPVHPQVPVASDTQGFVFWLCLLSAGEGL